RPHGPVLQEDAARLPDGGVWVDALDYDELRFAVPRPSDRLVYDGFARGEERIRRFTRGSGLAAGFGADRGDAVRYTVPLANGIGDAVLLIRWRAEEGSRAVLRAEGLYNGTLALAGDSEVRLHKIPVGDVPPGKHRLDLVS